MAEKESFRQIQARAIERLRRGEQPSKDETTKEQENCYTLFYPLKSTEPPRVNVPPTAPGARRIEDFYSKHRKEIREISPYGSLSESNPRVVELAASAGISVVRFIDNVRKFKASLDKYNPPKK